VVVWLRNSESPPTWIPLPDAVVISVVSTPARTRIGW
ncbi:MAG: hypothetical protein ACI855_000767, partial [Myxococcota bacterium]